MAIDFKLKDVIHHSITVKFFPAFLPDAKKPYNIRTQASASGGGRLLKNVRAIKTDFTVTIQR
ncbi:MAG: hypothetical protein LBK47_09670 [Prevotellaceae bacterium]|jgi:hypothetical protein|nr:hypothetical protein [Prevotellaceae bacterium]